MACRLAGKPVPQRAPPTNKRAADGDTDADRKSDTLNGSATGIKKPRVDLFGSQTSAPVKRRAEDQLTPEGKKTDTNAPKVSNFKRARVEDDTEDETSLAPQQAVDSASKKRVAFVDPAVLREDADGRTKRAKTDDTKEHSHFGLDGAAVATPRPSVTPFDFRNALGVDSKTTCSSCLDEHPNHDILQLPCKDEGDGEKHAYCRDCLQRLFESSVTDPSHFPPRCCSKIIPLFSCTPFLPQPLITRFVARREELETVDRTYCSDTKCSKWVRPENIEAKVANCPACGQKTCATCKGKHHEGLCPEDKDVKELLNVAKQKRWQTCPNCKEMVELEQGCYHITQVLHISLHVHTNSMTRCRCRHQFCYLCVAKWKTCKCPVWNERNIINPAERVAGPAAPAPAPVANPAPVPQQNPIQGLFAVPAQPQPVPRPALFNAAPPAFANAAPAPAPAPVQHQSPQQVAANNRKKNRRGRKQRNRQRAHEHDFERYYRSMGWDTTCHMCGHVDRWVNCCSECDLKVCWYCTTHRV